MFSRLFYTAKCTDFPGIDPHCVYFLPGKGELFCRGPTGGLFFRWIRRRRGTGCRGEENLLLKLGWGTLSGCGQAFHRRAPQELAGGRVSEAKLPGRNAGLFFGSRRRRRQTGFGSLHCRKRLGRYRSNPFRSRLGTGSRCRRPRLVFRRAGRFARLAGFGRFPGVRLVRAVCGRGRPRNGLRGANRAGVEGQHQNEGEQSP